MRRAEITNMNIPGNANVRAISESSLKTRFNTQSCKLNDSESRPNITLKKIGQELDIAETKCLTLKSELNYMMDVCRKGQIDTKGSKGTFDSLHEQVAPPSKGPGSVEYRNYASVASPKSAQFSPRKNTNDSDVVKCEILNGETQKEVLNVTITPRTQLDKILPPVITTVQNKSMKTSASREYKSLLSSYPEHLREYLQSKLDIEGSSEKLASKADENYFCMIPSCVREEDIGESEVNLNTPGDTKARQTAKCKYASGTLRNETNSACKTNDAAASKTRKKKGKVRSSVSKSTVMTKDTYLSGRKDAKRRRNRAGRGITRHQSALLKHTRKSNDVVEIFHNTTLKNSNSRMSANCSKLGRGARYAKKQNLTETANQKTKEKLYSEHVTRKYESRNKENQKQSLCLETSSRKSDTRVTVDSMPKQNKSGKQFNDLPFETLNRESDPRVTVDNSVQKQHKLERHLGDSSTQSKTHQRAHMCSSGFNDSMFTPNYEMPTLASKLKRSNRSYFGRFNFRNIPFVVSTSMTPSHNLGLNIQQVLSVMKTRQRIANDVAPLLIRNVSRSVKPVSTFLEQISVQYDKSIFNLKSPTTRQLNDKESPDVKRDRKLSVLELRCLGKASSVHRTKSGVSKPIPKSDSVFGQLCKEKGDFYEQRKMKQRPSLTANRSSTSAYAKYQPQISRMSLYKEDNSGDHKTHPTDSHNSKEIRDVLINLHDQFEEMNTRYEQLQSEMERSDDTTLPKELSTLEKELHVKEEEINAVIGLYKEVMSLKQQMKILHKKSSLVSVATKSSVEPRKNLFPMLIGKSHLTSTAQIFGRTKGSSVYGATREPPASMQLAALLRQIQAFHKQLQLVS